MKSPLPESSPAKGPRTKPAEVRLDELMNAAQALFLAHGVEATTINDIVARCQVAKGTFYHYFASKTEILEALARRYTEQFMQRLEDAVNACAPQDWSARLRAWVHANVITYLDTYATHDIVYANHHHHNRLNADRNAILEQLQGIIAGGVTDGVWQPADARVVALLIYSGVHGATDELICDPQIDARRFADAVADACLNMLSPAASI
ncbi:TetR/AcrR family transcriptional regulator [Bordetella trematum]|uniref:TetR/AcrR family transcriptional regulator n=1 Tax=Bordetella trematum TaxID=123899 RepID=UPI00398930D7